MFACIYLLVGFYDPSAKSVPGAAQEMKRDEVSARRLAIKVRQITQFRHGTHQLKRLLKFMKCEVFLAFPRKGGTQKEAK